MKRFTIKVVVLIFVLFFGVLMGMQYANEGLVKMKGYSDPNFDEPVSVEQTATGEVEAQFLGNELSTHDLEAKQQRLEEVKSYNIFSSIGKALAQFITGLIKGILSILGGIISLFT